MYTELAKLDSNKLAYNLILLTSISANADGPRDAASRKIDHIAHQV